MTITVVIPAKNEEKYISNCLKSVLKARVNLKQKYPGLIVQTIVADNLSNDKTRLKALEFEAEVISTDACSIAGVRNAGEKEAQGGILVFIDADSVMPQNTFVYVYEKIKNTNVKAGCFEIKPNKRLNFFYSSIIFFAMLFFRIINSGSGLFFCLKDDFEKINGFDESIYAGEDLDFVKRLKKHLKTKKQKFKNCSDINILTSTRKINFVNKKDALFQFIRFIISPKKSSRDKKGWLDIFYPDNKKLR